MLSATTFVINFSGLVIAVWLGLYLVSRNPHNRISLLTGGMLWAVGGLFLNEILAISPPPAPVTQPFWLQLLFPFWPEDVRNAGQNNWLLGWTIGPAIVMWHHVTTYLRGALNPWRVFRITAGYFTAALAVWLQFSTPWLYASASGNPLYINALRAGVMYPVFGLFILLFSGWSIINLFRSARSAQAEIIRNQLNTLALATLIAGLAAPIFVAGTYFGLPVPLVLVSVPLVIGVALIGWGVARYSALVEGRTIRRDFVHAALGSFLVMAAFLLVTAGLVQAYSLPAIAYVGAAFLAIASYSLYGALQRLLDRLLYGKETRDLQAGLRRLNRLVDSEAELDARLMLALDAMCFTVRSIYGLLYVFNAEQVFMRSQCRWSGGDAQIEPILLKADDVMHIKPGQFSSPFEDAALLIPLYVENEQTGAILMGRPQNGVMFSQEDVARLLDAGDMIADAVHRAKMNAEHMSKVREIAETQAPERPLAARVTVAQVEKALRNITDYAFLGDCPLAALKLSDRFLTNEGATTHLDRGKAVYQMLCSVLEKLRPDAEKVPGDPVPREWFAYLILRDAYLMDVPNRDIMSRLYISEGTFNRTRRASLRAVARVITEMEVGE